MTDPLMFEGQVLYNSIKDIESPKEALEKLATLEAPMGWVHIERSRAIAYAMWLKEKEMHDWYAYYENMLKFFNSISSGETFNPQTLYDIAEAPEGWIPPTEYLQGKVKE